MESASPRPDIGSILPSAATTSGASSPATPIAKTPLACLMLFFVGGEPFRLTMERGKIQSMTPPLTAEDIAPLIASLTPHERVRLFRLVTLPNLPNHRDAAAYESAPPAKDEFPVEDEPLAWDSDGWEEVE